MRVNLYKMRKVHAVISTGAQLASAGSQLRHGAVTPPDPGDLNTDDGLVAARSAPTGRVYSVGIPSKGALRFPWAIFDASLPGGNAQFG